VVNGLFQHPPPEAQPQSDPKNTHFRVHKCIKCIKRGRSAGGI